MMTKKTIAKIQSVLWAKAMASMRRLEKIEERYTAKKTANMKKWAANNTTGFVKFRSPKRFNAHQGHR